VKICAICNTEFVSPSGSRKYCSLNCSAEASAQRIRSFQTAVISATKKNKVVRIRKCAICSKRFVIKGPKKYCSEECSATAVVDYRQRIAEAARKIRSERPKETARCRECNEVFEKQRWNQIHCGTECSKYAQEARFELRGMWK